MLYPVHVANRSPRGAAFRVVTPPPFHLGASSATLANWVEQFTPVLLVVGLVLITAGMMMRLAKRNRRRSGGSGSSGGGAGAGGGGRLTAGERLERDRQAAGIRRDLESLMVEIEEMAKRLSHQLDAKAVRLEQLIDEADHRLTRLRRVAERLEQQDAAGGGSADAAAIDTDASSSTPDPAAGDLFTAPDASASAAGGGGSADEALTRSVYALADEGLDPADIARRLDEHTGKVELILALRQR